MRVQDSLLVAELTDRTNGAHVVPLARAVLAVFDVERVFALEPTGEGERSCNNITACSLHKPLNTIPAIAIGVLQTDGMCAGC
jgi:hypothetical protein